MPLSLLLETKLIKEEIQASISAGNGMALSSAALSVPPALSCHKAYAAVTVSRHSLTDHNGCHFPQSGIAGCRLGTEEWE
jgi:hypothetical protein